MVLQSEGITERSATCGVVKDAPDVLGLRLMSNCGRKGLQKVFCIGRVVHSRAAVKTIVDEFVPATRIHGIGDWCGVRSDSGNLEPFEEMIGFGDKPTGMAWFEDSGAVMQIAVQDEESFCDLEIEGGFWRKLEENRAKFVGKTFYF